MVERRSTCLAAYELVAAVLLGRAVDAPTCARAYALSLSSWERLLALEGCAAQFHVAVRNRDDLPALPEPLRGLLHAAFMTALQRALQITQQLPEIAAVAQAHGIRVLALKGAARLLHGEMAGTRSVADLDLLVRPAEAELLHRLLRERLGYGVLPEQRAAAHHLAGLTRSGGSGVEIHTRLSDRHLSLDDAIWSDAHGIAVGSTSVGVPSATAMVLHALEHAVALNWDLRYRLRDVLDIASLWTEEVDAIRVRAHVAASAHRGAMETLLSAAHAARETVPHYPRARAGVVRRVARARLAAAMQTMSGATAARLYRYVGVFAESSPRELVRASWQIVRRAIRPSLTAILLLTSSRCTGVTSPEAAPPAVIYTSHVDGPSAIYRARNDSIVRLSATGDEDSEPRIAAGHVVFTSRRDGDSEVYIAGLDLSAQRRLTTRVGFDGEPALDPMGTTVAFVSDRSGTPRLWLMDADGANPRLLDTGSLDYVPERAPVWNPAGDRIAFTSTLTNTSQVYVIPRSGGAAVQLSHESTGAFDPAWSADGATLLYTSLAGPATIMAVSATGSSATLFASEPHGLGEVACVAGACVAVLDPAGTAAGVVVLTGTPADLRSVVTGPGDHHHPAILPR